MPFFKTSPVVESRALSKKAMSQTLGRRKKSFMVGFPAELSWLKRNEEVGRRVAGSGGDVWGLQWGCFKGTMEGRGGWGVSPFDLFRAAKTEGGALPALANTFSW